VTTAKRLQTAALAAIAAGAVGFLLGFVFPGFQNVILLAILVIGAAIVGYEYSPGQKD
jgi:hypothetical protein